jgi:peptide-methionine (S)-S-oxide reductase
VKTENQILVWFCLTSSRFALYLRRRVVTISLILCAFLPFLSQRVAYSAEASVVVAPPLIDEPAGDARDETAVLAGGCFWAVQGVFQHVKGVTNVVSGYAGGRKGTANYKMVSAGNTGHAETVLISYDPTKITYGQLLQVFFSAAHDPTQLNRQGPDIGTQYRSVIFTVNDMQKRVAEGYIDQLNRSHAFSHRIVTRTEALKRFYPAETYHQNYLTLHPDEDYVMKNDLPKIDDLKRLFPNLYRDKPVLVQASNS